MKKFQVRLEQIGGCGDGGCMIHVRPGMHTNGGCRCSTNPLKMRQTVHVYKGAVAAQAQEVGRLREALKAAQDQFQFYADEHRSAGKTEKAQTNQAMADRCDAALQPKEETQ